jgi:Na+(H+)/acetate symporter ActP
MFLIVAGFWAWEAVVLKNDYTFRKLPIWRYWVVPLAVLAFWYPSSKGRPDFNPVNLITSGSGLAFCLMTPVYLTLLSLYWPRVNMPAMRVTSLVGLIIGLYNMYVNFGINPGRLWWNGVLHIPLLSISVYGLILSLKKGPCQQGHSKSDVL